MNKLQRKETAEMWASLANEFHKPRNCGRSFVLNKKGKFVAKEEK